MSAAIEGLELFGVLIVVLILIALGIGIFVRPPGQLKVDDTNKKAR